MKTIASLLKKEQIVSHCNYSRGWLTLPNGKQVTPKPSVVKFLPEAMKPIVFRNGSVITSTKRVRQMIGTVLGSFFYFSNGGRNE